MFYLVLSNYDLVGANTTRGRVTFAADDAACA
jgi:hypothetical protein